MATVAAASGSASRYSTANSAASSKVVPDDNDGSSSPPKKVDFTLSPNERTSKGSAGARKSSAAEIAKVKNNLRNLEGGPWVVLPTVKWMWKWDLTTSSALVFTAFVTPYEVAMLETELNELFWINRCIDVVFVIDLCMCFFLAYRLPMKRGGGLVKDLASIRHNYLRTWFLVDIISVLPLDILAVTSSSPSQLKAMRLIRLLRLLKLMRVIKASRILQRFEEKITVPYAIVSMCKFMTLLLIVGHWMACVWVMIGGLQSPDINTWLDALRAGKYEQRDAAWVADPPVDECPEYRLSDDGEECEHDPLRGLHHSEAYSAAIYWAIVTMTSIGYGDVTPMNRTEMLAGTLILLLGSCLWAYIIGSFCSLISALEVETMEHQQLMDQLTELINEHQLDDELKVNLRAYFMQRKKLNRAAKEQRIMELLPPSLRMQAVKGKCDWLLRISYFKNSSPRMLTEIEARLKGHVFPPAEQIMWRDAIRHLSSGMASRDGRVMCTGAFWGEDCVLHNKALKITSQVNALTYVEMLEISRTDLLDVLSEFPGERVAVRRQHLRLAVMRGIMYTSSQMLEGEKKAALGVGPKGLSVLSFKMSSAVEEGDDTHGPTKGQVLHERKNSVFKLADDGPPSLEDAMKALEAAKAAVATSQAAVAAALAREHDVGGGRGSADDRPSLGQRSSLISGGDEILPGAMVHGQDIQSP